MDKSQPSIFVSIASYCDPALPRTLDDCLATARQPENLRFGICWQYDKRQGIDLGRFKTDRRFRLSEHSYRQSQGGSWARSIAQTFWDGEDYSLQVDSHMAFAPNWDMSLVRTMRSLPADKPLITMIAPLFRIDDKGRLRKDTHFGVRATKLAHWREEEHWAPWFDWGERSHGHATRNRFLSGQFVFTLGRWTEEVRQDPQHYYWGEEFALTLRSYTHGYDLFLPDEIVAWHMDHQDGPPRRHWEHGESVMAKKNGIALDRLRCLAYSDDPQDQASLGRYGLGRTRSRRAYERFAGLDLRKKKAHPNVFSGRCPNPMTISAESDWAECLTYDAYSQTAALLQTSSKPSSN